MPGTSPGMTLWEWKGVIRRLATEAMADYACANPPYGLKMYPA
jgi:hypothetical protein